jgi:hypothetical protein
MGRVYDVKTHPNVRCYDPTGHKMTGVFRIEFDEDDDEGMATVHAFVRNDQGNFFVGEVSGPDTAKEPVKCVFRMYARVRERPSPDVIGDFKYVVIDGNGHLWLKSRWRADAAIEPEPHVATETH